MTLNSTNESPRTVMHDSRVRSVQWRDLVGLSLGEAIRELMLPLPWLGAELALHALHHHIAGCILAFMFFLACLRVAHDVFHRNLSLPRNADEFVLAVMSPLMLTSLHAIRVTHLRHHVHCLDDDDAEAASAHTTGARAVLLGPVFAIKTHAAGIIHGTSRERMWMGVEAMLCFGLVALAIAFRSDSFLVWHVALMFVGQALSPFFAVWTVHHDCDRSYVIARTLRNRFKSLLVLDMFFHLEHHLFPRVPTKRLPMLAERLDQAAPELARRQVY